MMPKVCPSRVAGRAAVTKPLAASIDPFVGSNMASAMTSTPFIARMCELPEATGTSRLAYIVRAMLASDK
jgi:hypothetical protein